MQNIILSKNGSDLPGKGKAFSGISYEFIIDGGPSGLSTFQVSWEDGENSSYMTVTEKEFGREEPFSDEIEFDRTLDDFFEEGDDVFMPSGRGFGRGIAVKAHSANTFNKQDESFSGTYRTYILETPVSSITKVAVEENTREKNPDENLYYHSSGYNAYRALDYSNDEIGRTIGNLFHVTNIGQKTEDLPLSGGEETLTVNCIENDTGSRYITFTMSPLTFTKKENGEFEARTSSRTGDGYYPLVWDGEGWYQVHHTSYNGGYYGLGKFDIVDTYTDTSGEYLVGAFQGDTTKKLYFMSGMTDMGTLYSTDVYYNHSTEPNVSLYNVEFGVQLIYLKNPVFKISSKYLQTPVPGVAYVIDNDKVYYNKVEPGVGNSNLPKMIFKMRENETDTSEYTWPELGFTQDIYDAYLGIMFSDNFSPEQLNAFIEDDKSNLESMPIDGTYKTGVPDVDRFQYNLPLSGQVGENIYFRTYYASAEYGYEEEVDIYPHGQLNAENGAPKIVVSRKKTLLNGTM